MFGLYTGILQKEIKETPAETGFPAMKGLATDICYFKGNKKFILAKFAGHEIDEKKDGE